jgi:hypothetical protein
MKDRLPEYIYNREKVVLSEGAGYKGNQLIGGMFYDFAKKKITDREFTELKKKYPDWNITNKEVAYYFRIYAKHLFTKAKFNKERPLVNAIDSVIREESSQKAEKIFNIFKDKKLFRDKPFKEIIVKRKIVEAIEKNEPIKVVGYWGVEKRKIGNPETEAMRTLKTIKTKIQKTNPQCEIILIFTDLHGEINNLSKSLITGYYKTVKDLSRKFGFKMILLSDIWKENNVNPDDVFENNKEKLSEWWQKHPLKEKLIKSADRHSHRDNRNESAKLYALASEFDSKFIKDKYKNSIFFTYNSSTWQKILPKLPTLYLWGVGKDKITKPWHLKDSKEQK